MAQLTFFNPDTWEKLFEGEGQVFRTDQPDMINNGPWNNPQADPVQQLIDMQERMMKRDEQPKAFTAEGQATVHISRRKWKRLEGRHHNPTLARADWERQYIKRNKKL